MAQDLTAISTPGTTTQGPAFKAWFRNSVVRNPDGSPRPVYHGSTHSFEAFSLKPGNPENWYGKALYFTDSPEDVGRNYATPDSPDLRVRIDKRTEQLMDRLVDELEQELGEALNWNDPRKDRLFQDAKSQATRELMGPGAISYKLYLRIERPVVVRQGGGTYFEIDHNERTGKETGSGMRLYRAVMKAAGQLNLPNSDEIWRQSVSADEGMTEGFTAQQFDENLRHSDAMMEARDWDATNEGEFLSLVYRLAGYDGIIMEDAGATFHNMGIPPGTRHYIIWNPRQAKSAIGNTGTWSTRTPRLTAGWEEDEGDYGVEDYPQCLGDYEFRTTCVSEGTGEHIQEMLDNAKDCGYSEVKRHCEGLRPWEKENGYAPDGSRKGLTLRHDWAVRYGRGTYRRMPCYFVVWSGIEHVWTRKGMVSSKGAGKLDRAAKREWDTYIGVDLDGTLAEEITPFDPLKIGRPIPAMVEKVRKALADGVCIKVFTARLADKGLKEQIQEIIREWTKAAIGTPLESTNEKTPGMVEVWDRNPALGYSPA